MANFGHLKLWQFPKTKYVFAVGTSKTSTTVTGTESVSDINWILLLIVHNYYTFLMASLNAKIVINL